LRQCGPKSAVFHRAFDLVPDAFAALEQLIDLGICRVMTSGQQETAYNGVAQIAALIESARGRIEVLPAGGINRFNLRDIVGRTGCGQVHAGLRKRVSDPSAVHRPNMSFGAALKQSEDRYDVTDPDAVAELRALL
jgi:copper homeostasis protein